jgi:hypothetical protein
MQISTLSATSPFSPIAKQQFDVPERIGSCVSCSAVLLAAIFLLTVDGNCTIVKLTDWSVGGVL